MIYVLKISKTFSSGIYSPSQAPKNEPFTPIPLSNKLGLEVFTYYKPINIRT
jgi:hypothetical protein